MSGTNKLAKKYFLTPFWVSTKISLFCKVRACRFSIKNSIFQKLPQMLYKCFFWWVEQLIFQKNIFLPHFEIVQNFHYFVRGAPVDFPSKIQFSKNCLKYCRKVSLHLYLLLLMSGTNNSAKKYFLTPFWDSQKVLLFCKVRPCQFSVKNSIFQKLPQIL